MKLPKYYVDDGMKIMGFKDTRTLAIKGTEDLEYEELIQEVEKGERFCAFKYTILLGGYFHGLSPIFFRKNSKKAKQAQIGYSLLTGIFLLLILCIEAILLYITIIDFNRETRWLLIPCILLPFAAIPLLLDIIFNLKGGFDMTNEVLVYYQRYIEKKFAKQLQS